MNKIIYIIFLTIFSLTLSAQTIVVGETGDAKGPFKVIGKIYDSTNNEGLIGASIYIINRKEGFVSDFDGNFEILLNPKEYEIEVKYLGFETMKVNVDVRGEGRLDFAMEPTASTLEEILISSDDPFKNVRQASMGVEKLSIKTIEALPQFIGEVDILKSLVLLPGVSSVGEISAGFNVRGGGFDQNMILLGGATLYNPSHLFGFFSSFNSDLISGVTVYKGGIPSNYGGRASSIVDLSYKTGDMQKWHGNVSIGTISGKATVEGPIIKDKLSVVLGFRNSYANWLLGAVDDPDINNSSANFYDGNAIVRYRLSDKVNFVYSLYNSSDDFQLPSSENFQWSNFNHGIDFGYSPTDKSLISLKVNNSQYSYNISSDDEFENFDLDAKVNDYSGKLEFDYAITDRNGIKAGVEVRQMKVEPGSLQPQNDDSNVKPKFVDAEQGREMAAFIQNNIEIGERLGVDYGVRFNRYQYLGPRTQFSYLENLPRTEETISGETVFGSGETVKSYSSIEPRLALRFSINDNTSLKFGYNRMTQFIHLISNTTTIAPTDLWKLSDEYLKPQAATQYSAGIFKNFSENKYEISLEGYYKNQTNVVEYKDGADLILNNHLETELLNGDGEAYGAEFSLKKSKGRLKGWLSYTYSKSLRRVIGSYPQETINNGNWYPSNYDKPHDFTVTADYKVSNYISTSAIFTYSMGRPITFPTAKFLYQGEFVAYFEDRNANRIPDYHRLDLALKWHFKTDSPIFGGEWSLSVYNAYGRRNAFSVFFDDLPGEPPSAYKLAVLGIPFPSLSYNVKW